MKKHLLLICLMLGQLAIAQDMDKIGILERKIDSLCLLVDSLRTKNIISFDEIVINQSVKNRYKMYKTENVYNLLELDTQTGIVKQIQWGVGNTYEGWWYINSEDLNINGSGPGTFELYSTLNMYQFILLDKTDGRRWHIQWGIDDDKRWIRQIY